MPLKPDWKLSDEDGRQVRTRIIEEIARRHISRRHLADMARISLSTLEKVLSGRRTLTLSTLVRIEEALGLTLRSGAEPIAAQPNGHTASLPLGVAPDDLGSYARPAVKWIEGAYLTIRPSFGDASAVYAYATEILWDDAASILTFREGSRTDHEFTQFGHVAVPNQSGHVYLVTNRHGQYRLTMLSRPTISGEMHGILATLKVGRGSQLTPVAAPIAFVPLKPEAPPPAYGQIRPGHAAFDSYRALLRRTTNDEFAVLLSGLGGDRSTD